MTKHKKMDYINISKSIFFSLAISFVGCASDGDKGIQTTNKEEVASSEEEKSQQTSDYNSYVPFGAAQSSTLVAKLHSNDPLEKADSFLSGVSTPYEL